LSRDNKEKERKKEQESAELNVASTAISHEIAFLLAGTPSQWELLVYVKKDWIRTTAFTVK